MPANLVSKDGKNSIPLLELTVTMVLSSWRFARGKGATIKVRVGFPLPWCAASGPTSAIQ
jgi:hypothetical protein